MSKWIGLLLCLGCVQSVQAREAIWIEGEDAFLHNFNNHPWYSSSDLALDLLSPGREGAEAGDWLSHFGQDAGGPRRSNLCLRCR